MYNTTLKMAITERLNWESDFFTEAQFKEALALLDNPRYDFDGTFQEWCRWWMSHHVQDAQCFALNFVASIYEN